MFTVIQHGSHPIESGCLNISEHQISIVGSNPPLSAKSEEWPITTGLLALPEICSVRDRRLSFSNQVFPGCSPGAQTSPTGGGRLFGLSCGLQCDARPTRRSRQAFPQGCQEAECRCIPSPGSGRAWRDASATARKKPLEAGRPWSPTGVAVHHGDVYILEYTNANGSPREGWRPRVRKLGRDGKVTTLMVASPEPTKSESK